MDSKTCDRCGASLRGHASITSMFDTSTICVARCKIRERMHPNYTAANAAETAAVRAGDYNFPGVGVPASLSGPASQAEECAIALSPLPNRASRINLLETLHACSIGSHQALLRYRFPDNSIVLVAPTTFEPKECQHG